MIIKNVRESVNEVFCTKGKNFFDRLVKRGDIKIRKDGSVNISLQRIFELYGRYRRLKKEKGESRFSYGNEFGIVYKIISGKSSRDIWYKMISEGNTSNVRYAKKIYSEEIKKLYGKQS